MYDNCDGGRNEHYDLFCNVLLAGGSFTDLNATCEQMGGRLAWFDTSLEHSELMTLATTQYSDIDLNSFYHTGKDNPDTHTGTLYLYLWYSFEFVFLCHRQKHSSLALLSSHYRGTCTFTVLVRYITSCTRSLLVHCYL